MYIKDYMDSTICFENKRIACLCTFGETNENIAGKNFSFGIKYQSNSGNYNQNNFLGPIFCAGGTF